MKPIRMILSGIAVVVAIGVMFLVNSKDDSATVNSDDALKTDAQTTTASASDAAMPSVTPPPAIGDVAPAVSLESNEGNMVSLADYKGSWVVLYFYPKDFTQGCTIEAKKFQNDLSEYHDRNAVILGVSLDTADSHKDFCAKESLEFKLLADIGGDVSEEYGSLNTRGESRYSARNTFVINPEGVVSKVFMKVNPTPHSKEVLAALDQLQSD